jgi:tRNA nucleotidyltransferase (CCA-adding enzyme)
MSDRITRSLKQVGETIRSRRRSLGLKQAELGERSCLRQATISALEAGEPGTRLSTLFEVLESLKLDAVVRPRGRPRIAGPEIPADELATDAHARAFDSLSKWAGYEALSAAMREYPDVSVYLAGGALRDLLRASRHTPKDFDLFVLGANLERFLGRLSAAGTLRYGPFGSPRWFPNGAADRYADVIPITHFYNGLWRCRDILDALNQFDFTANAIAVDLRRPRLFDPQNGLRDVRLGVMRAVRFDYPDEPIGPGEKLTRPAVLWFRLIHYAQALRFKIEPVTLQWLRANRRFSADIDRFSKLFFRPNSGTLRL